MFTKKNLSALLIIVFSFAFQYLLIAQSQFEGKLKIQVTEEGKKHTMDYFVKGDKFRLEVKDMGETGAMIFDSKAMKMTIVMPQQKMYMEMPLDGIDTESYFDESTSKAKIKKTGESKTINGYKCEKWIIEDEGLNTEAWITTELGGFLFSGNPMAGGGSDWTSKLSAQSFFPMLAKVYESGKHLNTFEVLEVNKQKLDNSLFSAPSGYQKFEMPSFNLQNLK
jgi:frataxin-like iron-binding protein CyaY